MKVFGSFIVILLSVIVILLSWKKIERFCKKKRANADIAPPPPHISELEEIHLEEIHNNDQSQ